MWELIQLSSEFWPHVWLQVFLFTLLSLIILISSSGEDNFMESMMISDVFHFLAAQRLSCFFKLASNRTSFTVMIGKQLLLYGQLEFHCWLYVLLHHLIICFVMVKIVFDFLGTTLLGFICSKRIKFCSSLFYLPQLRVPRDGTCKRIGILWSWCPAAK